MPTQESEPMTAETAVKFLEQNRVSFVNLWFPDVLGRLNSMSINIDDVAEALEMGVGFDGSSIEGFVRIEESDLVAKPIPSTVRLLAYRPKEEHAVAVMICEIYNPDGSRFLGDSLYALERQLTRMGQLGFDQFYVGPELEFFLLTDKRPGEVADKLLDNGRYFGLADDAGKEVRRDIVLACRNMRIRYELSHHEVAASQHEIDLRYDDAYEMSFQSMIYRHLVKEIAQQHGVYATFMPKPVFGINGNGMHVHQSLFRDDKNAFFDETDEYGLSQVAKRYVAGILQHAPEFVAVTNQWVNSYQRLVPGYEAPTELSWARRNRSTAVRVPNYQRGNERSVRIEVRFPDPACNLPLAFAVMLASGLEGIERGYDLPDPIEENIYQLGDSERQRRGVVSLPGNLEEATGLLESSRLIKDVLGEHIFESLIANQKAEWREYWLEATGREIEEHRVTRYEVEKFVPEL